MKEASHVGTSVSFPKFSVSVSILGLGLSVALVKKCTVTVPSFLGLYSGVLCLLGTRETRVQEGHCTYVLVIPQQDQTDGKCHGPVCS